MWRTPESNAGQATWAVHSTSLRVYQKSWSSAPAQSLLVPGPSQVSRASNDTWGMKLTRRLSPGTVSRALLSSYLNSKNGQEGKNKIELELINPSDFKGKKTVFHLFLLVFQGQTDKPMNQTSKSRTPWPAAGWSSQAVQVFVALVVPCQVPQVVELPLNQVGNLPGGIFQALVARKHVFWTKRYEAKLSQSLDMFQTFESTFNPRHTIFLVHISIRTIPWTW